MAMSPEEKAKAKKALEKKYAAESKKMQPKVSESLKVGAKAALSGAGKLLSGGMAGKARDAIADTKDKTRKEIEKQTK